MRIEVEHIKRARIMLTPADVEDAIEAYLRSGDAIIGEITDIVLSPDGETVVTFEHKE